MGSLSKRRPRAPRSGVLTAMSNGLLDFARPGSRTRARTGAAGSSRREDLGGEAAAPAESASPSNHVSGDPRSAPMPGADPGAEADGAQAGRALLCMPFATNQSERSLHTARFVELADQLPEGAKKVKERLEGMSKLWQEEIDQGLFKPRLKKQRRFKATELMKAAHAAENELIRKKGLRQLRQPHLPELGTRAAAAPANGGSGGTVILHRLCPSIVFWREETAAGTAYHFTTSKKAEEQAADRGFVRCAVQHLEEVTVPAPAPVTAPAQVRIPASFSMPRELYEDEGKGFISKVEDGWEETTGDEKVVFDGLWMWTPGERSRAWKGSRKLQSKFCGVMAVYWALIHFNQLEGVTSRTWNDLATPGNQLIARSEQDRKVECERKGEPYKRREAYRYVCDYIRAKKAHAAAAAEA
jgi:hypothetical protein